jgi:molybdopterin-binding protein
VAGRSATGQGNRARRNRFEGIVRSVDSDGVMALVEIEAGSFLVTAAMRRDSIDELGLAPGVPRTAVVKATSAMIGRDWRHTGGGQMMLTARNKLAGTVVAFTTSEAIANVAPDVAGQRLVASSTVETVEDLGRRQEPSCSPGSRPRM